MSLSGLASLTPGELVVTKPTAPAQCDYCGRYGALGVCEGCGASTKPVVRPERLDVTSLTDKAPRFILTSERVLNARETRHLEAEWQARYPWDRQPRPTFSAPMIRRFGLGWWIRFTAGLCVGAVVGGLVLWLVGA